LIGKEKDSVVSNVFIFSSDNGVEGVVKSVIGLSHNRPNQFSEQIHANLRAEFGTFEDDSMHSPWSPHGLIGLHNDNGEKSVVELDSSVVVLEDDDDVDETHDGVVVVQETVGDSCVDVVVSQSLDGDRDDVVVDHVVVNRGPGVELLSEVGGTTTDGQLHDTRISSQIRSPHERK